MAAIFPPLQFVTGGRTYSLQRLMATEFIAMERVTGQKGVKAFLTAIAEFDATAILALVWVGQKREDPTLAFADVDVDLGDFEVQFMHSCGRPGHVADFTRNDDGTVSEAPCALCAAEDQAAADPVTPDPTGAVTATAPASAQSPVELPVA